MPQYKVTFIFNQNRLGWTETWYLNVSNLKAAQDAANAYSTKRQAMLGIGSKMEAWRISDVDQPRLCTLTQAPFGVTGDLFTDTAWNGILTIVCAGDALYRRSFIIRGVPDDWIKWSNALDGFATTNAFLSAWKSFCEILKTGWQLKVISKDPLDQAVSDHGPFVADVNGNVSFVQTNPLAVGKEIRLKGVTGPDAKLLNGVHIITKNTGTAVSINLPFDQLTQPTLDVGGKTVNRVQKYANVTDCRPEGPAKRSTGRAFFVPRGRQRAKR